MATEYWKYVGKNNTGMVSGRIYKVVCGITQRCGGALNGEDMRPNLDRDYWKSSTEGAYQFQMEENEFEQLCANETKNEPMENDMGSVSERTESLVIEDAVLINGHKVDTFSEGQIIGMIKSQQDKIKALKEVGVKSKLMEIRIADYTNNINELVEILDSRVEVSD